MAARSSALLALSLALLAASQALALPQPPLRALWSWHGDEHGYGISDVLFDGTVVYLADTRALVALDLESGKERWRKVVPQHARWNTFAANQPLGDGRLIAVAAHDGLYSHAHGQDRVARTQQR